MWNKARIHYLDPCHLNPWMFFQKRCCFCCLIRKLTQKLKFYKNASAASHHFVKSQHRGNKKNWGPSNSRKTMAATCQGLAVKGGTTARKHAEKRKPLCPKRAADEDDFNDGYWWMNESWPMNIMMFAMAIAITTRHHEAPRPSRGRCRSWRTAAPPWIPSASGSHRWWSPGEVINRFIKPMVVMVDNGW